MRHWPPASATASSLPVRSARARRHYVTVSAWRIVKHRHASQAFSGEGARLYGGRWNTAGIPVIYASSSQSLAALEMLVHLEEPGLLAAYDVIQADFNQNLVEEPAPRSLPSNWRDDIAATQRFGDDWARRLRSVVLSVPSAIIPAERNFLFNPRHPRFTAIVIHKAQRFVFDQRLHRK